MSYWTKNGDPYCDPDEEHIFPYRYRQSQRPFNSSSATNSAAVAVES